jgi:hypothetical protein
VFIEEDIRMNVHIMVLIWKLAHSLSIKIKHLKHFSNEG